MPWLNEEYVKTRWVGHKVIDAIVDEQGRVIIYFDNGTHTELSPSQNYKVVPGCVACGTSEHREYYPTILVNTFQTPPAKSA